MSDGILDVGDAPKLDSPGRIKDLRPYQLLKEVAGVTGGLVCVDFGSGTGTFALPLAEIVGDKGKVYAVDRSTEMLDHIRDKNPPPNLQTVHSDVIRTPLEDRIADICLLAFIVHEVKQPGELIAEATRLLRPGGRVVVIEWRADIDGPGPPRRVRLSRQKIEDLLKQADLSPKSYTDWTKNHYVAVGKK